MLGLQSKSVAFPRTSWFFPALAHLCVLASALRPGEPPADPKLAANLSQIRATLKDWETHEARVLASVKGAKASKQLREALALGRNCRWEECAKRIRSFIDTEEEQLRGEASFFGALLVAVEFGARSNREEIEGVFSAAKAEFKPESGELLLQFADATPKAWELEGNRGEGSGTVELGGGRALSIQVPFLRVPLPARPGSEPRSQGCSFQGRVVGLGPDCSLEFTWRAVEETAAQKTERIGVTCRWASDKAENGWVFIDLERGKIVKPYSKRQLVKTFFQSWRNLRADLGEEGAVFSIDGSTKQSVRFVGPEVYRASLQGKGRAVSLDWVQISGAVDGLWLARQLFLRLEERPEAFLKTWNDPFAPRGSPPGANPEDGLGRR